MSLSSYQNLSLGDQVSTQLSQEKFLIIRSFHLISKGDVLTFYWCSTKTKITTLDSLSQHGINMADIERVKSAGINTIKGLVKLSLIISFRDLQTDAVRSSRPWNSLSGYMLSNLVRTTNVHIETTGRHQRNFWCKSWKNEGSCPKTWWSRIRHWFRICWTT